MNVLIIGGTRFMGRFAARQLHEAGHRVTVFHRGRHEGDLPDGVEHVHGDRKALEEHAEQLRGLAPEVVLDMMALTERHAEVLMETFRGVTRRVVVASSQDVYRAYDVLRKREPGPEPVPLTEDSALRDQLYPYRSDPPRAEDAPDRWMDEYDKILIERVVLSDPRLPGTVLRLPAVSGPGAGQHRLFPYLKRMDDGRPAILVEQSIAEWRWSRAYVENAAAAILRTVLDERAAGRAYNVHAPECLREGEWIERVGAAAGWAGRVVLVPDGTLPDSLAWWRDLNLGQQLPSDDSRIRRELGFREEVGLDEGLRRAVEWERASPPETIDRAAFDYAAEDHVFELRQLR